VVQVVEDSGSGDLERAYVGNGSAAYHPALLLALLNCGCASAQSIEQEDLQRLCEESCRLKMDLDILKKATALFAKKSS
jgi:transposase-like protein